MQVTNDCPALLALVLLTMDQVTSPTATVRNVRGKGTYPVHLCRERGADRAAPAIRPAALCCGARGDDGLRLPQALA